MAVIVVIDHIGHGAGSRIGSPYQAIGPLIPLLEPFTGHILDQKSIYLPHLFPAIAGRKSGHIGPYPKIITIHFVNLVTTYPNIRSEEHTSELQSRENLVCRLLLEKK